MFLMSLTNYLLHIFSCQRKSAAALEKTFWEEKGEEGNVQDISNFSQYCISDDLLETSGGYQGRFS